MHVRHIPKFYESGSLKDSLGDNWNGEGDIPIEEKAYNNAKTAILATPGAMLKKIYDVLRNRFDKPPIYDVI